MGNIIARLLPPQTEKTSKTSAELQPAPFDDFKTYTIRVIGIYTLSFLALQHLKILHPFLRLLFPRIDEMTKGDLMQWNSRILSSVNAVGIAIAGTYALYKDRKLISDPFYHHNHLTQHILLSLLGYLIYDMILVATHFRVFKDTGAIVHHLLFILACTIGGLSKTFHGLGLFFTLNELSTPWLNLRWHFNKYEQISKQKVPTMLAFCNLSFLFIFFLFGRVIVNTYAAHRTIKTVFFSNSVHSPRVKITGAIIPALAGLNYYWFGLILIRIRQLTDKMRDVAKQC